MVDRTLDGRLRLIAEQYLQRPLEPQETQQLLQLQQSFLRQPAAPDNPIQQARQQVQQQTQQAFSQAQANTGSIMRGILESIQTNSDEALQVQEQEEQAILKLLEGCKTLSDLRPSSLQPGMSGLQPGSQLALTQIAEHLSNLARKEVEKCFDQYVGPLVSQLRVLLQRLNEQEVEAAKAAGHALQAPAPTVATQAAAPNNLHVPGGQTSLV
jgi:hypothetical protein